MKDILGDRLIGSLQALILLAALSLQAQPTITTQPASQTILSGSNVTFTVTASGGGLLSYQWCLSGTNLSKYVLTTIAGGGAAGDGGLATAASLNGPDGVARDARVMYSLRKPWAT